MFFGVLYGEELKQTALCGENLRASVRPSDQISANTFLADFLQNLM